MTYNTFVILKIQAFIFCLYTNMGNIFIISIVLPSDMIWIKSTLHWLYIEHIFIQKDYWHSIKHSLTSYFIAYIQNGYTWESFHFQYVALVFIYFSFIVQYFMVSFIFIWYKLDQICFCNVVCKYFLFEESH